LISVFDKTGIVDLSSNLHTMGVEILSTGGTAKILREAEIPVIDVSDYTGFPEIMDGRVKTLNPLVAGGILGLRDLHQNETEQNDIKWIDLVVCNLYPFLNTITQQNIDFAFAMENIDIGGPTMIRSAAKNMGWCGVITAPSDYQLIIDELCAKHSLSFETRKYLATKAFATTAQYDSIIHTFLKDQSFSNTLNLTFDKHSTHRYGENPHQEAAVYKIPGNSENNILNAKIHQGKRLSYNNIMDADGALACLREFSATACVVVKHSNPCGVAVGVDLLDVYTRAFQADSLSAFGGIIALNRACTSEVAQAIAGVFVEIVLAPSFEPEALAIFSKKKNLRVLEIGNMTSGLKKLEVRNIDGGLLVQETNLNVLTLDQLSVVTDTTPTDDDLKTMCFGWKVLKHIKSNGILIVKNDTTVGMGAGQVSRVDSVEIAIRKAGEKIQGSILCSDAFFPFRDSIDKIAKTGIKAVIQPGGSIRDKEVIDACNEYGVAMVFTGERCFKH